MTKLTGFLLGLGLITGGLVRAQAPGVAIEPPKGDSGDAALTRKAGELKEAGRLLSLEQVGAQLREASNASLVLPSPSHRALQPSRIYRRARESRVQIGWYYLCRNCSRWHFNGAGGYPIAKGGVLATCYHVVSAEEDRPNMREAYLLAVDSEGRVSPVAKILARSKTMDTAIVLAPALPLKPLPLNTNVAPGDTVYCYSDPLGLKGLFTQGIINRFFWNSRSGGAKGSLDEVKRLRLNVSCSWAPGSSGCAIFDDCGNVMGHVSTWGLLQKKPPAAHEDEAPAAGGQSPPTKPSAVRNENASNPGFHFYEAIPALGVRALAEGPRAARSSNVR